MIKAIQNYFGKPSKDAPESAAAEGGSVKERPKETLFDYAAKKLNRLFAIPLLRKDPAPDPKPESVLDEPTPEVVLVKELTSLGVDKEGLATVVREIEAEIKPMSNSDVKGKGVMKKSSARSDLDAKTFHMEDVLFDDV
jgi:hypothetical protein